MDLLRDLISLLAGCFRLLLSTDPRAFAIAVAVGIGLAALCWVGCSRYSRLWNLRYRVKISHHVLCGVAAFLTLAFVMTYAALRFTKEAAYSSVERWENELKSDGVWKNRTFQLARDRVKSLGKENFTGVDQHTIPMRFPDTISIVGTADTEESSKHFRQSRPFLSMLLRAKTDVPKQVVEADIQQFFAIPGNHTYPAERGIEIVAREIRSGLDAQVPRVVIWARWIAIFAFLLMQCIPFGLVGIAAYRDLKYRT